jgi:NitT/TauT family transport system permease protein
MSPTEGCRARKPGLDDLEESLLATAIVKERRNKVWRRRRIGGLQIALLIIVLGTWQIASGRWVDSLFLSNPISISQAFIRISLDGSLWWHLEVTLVEMTLGYILGVCGGIAIAFMVSIIPLGQPIARPLMMMAFATPKVALAPLIVIWFGIGLFPKIILAASLVFFVIYFNALVGISSSPPSTVAVLRLMNASRMTVFRKVVLPCATPYIVTAMRITLPAALIGAIIGEFISSSRGIGYLIAAASSRYDTAQVFAGIGSLVGFVLLLNAGVTALEHYLLRWRPADMAAASR